MKVTMTDANNKHFSVCVFERFNQKSIKDEIVLTLETEDDVLTFPVTKKILDQLASSIQFMKGNL